LKTTLCVRLSREPRRQGPPDRIACRAGRCVSRAVDCEHGARRRKSWKGVAGTARTAGDCNRLSGWPADPSRLQAVLSPAYFTCRTRQAARGSISRWIFAAVEISPGAVVGDLEREPAFRRRPEVARVASQCRRHRPASRTMSLILARERATPRQRVRAQARGARYSSRRISPGCIGRIPFFGMSFPFNVIHDLDVEGISARPAKTDRQRSLIRMLCCPAVAVQSFEPVPWRRAQELERSAHGASRASVRLRPDREPPAWAPACEERRSVLVGERLDHRRIVCRAAFNGKR